MGNFAMALRYREIGLAAALCVLVFASAQAADEPVMQCFSTAQTRDHMLAQKLIEPFAAMRAASGVEPGDPIGVRLCRTHDDFMYEINLLRRDGRVMKIFIDAVSGKPHSSHKER